MLIYWEKATCFKESAETLVVDTEEIGLDINADKITCMVILASMYFDIGQQI
jgi:hypothetical protein